LTYGCASLPSPRDVLLREAGARDGALSRQSKRGERSEATDDRRGDASLRDSSRTGMPPSSGEETRTVCRCGRDKSASCKASSSHARSCEEARAVAAWVDRLGEGLPCLVVKVRVCDKGESLQDVVVPWLWLGVGSTRKEAPSGAPEWRNTKRTSVQNRAGRLSIKRNVLGRVPS
jgi:hypothetical protein